MNYKRYKKLLYRLGKFSSFAVLVPVAILVLSSLLPIPGGIKIYTVLTGSMEPAVPTGAMIFTKKDTNTAELKGGDIITFTSPRSDDILITHRITEVIGEGEGLRFITKGDANGAIDPWEVRSDAIRGHYMNHVPLLGYLLEFTKSLPGLLLLVIAPTILIAISEVKNIVAVLLDRKIQELRQLKAEIEELRQTPFSSLSQRRWTPQEENKLVRLTKLQKIVDSVQHIPPSQPANKHIYAVHVVPLTVLFLVVGSTYSALVSNTVMLSGNVVSTAAVFPTPTPSLTPTPTSTPEPTTTPEPTAEPTPTPSPTPGDGGPCDTDITVDQSNTNTGPGSTNTNDVTVNQNCDVNVETTTTVTNTIDVDVNTGGNTSTGNTEGGGINTGGVTIDLSINNNL